MYVYVNICINIYMYIQLVDIKLLLVYQLSYIQVVHPG